MELSLSKTHARTRARIASEEVLRYITEVKNTPLHVKVLGSVMISYIYLKY